MSSGLEALIEFGRRRILKQDSWSIRDHYVVQASFWLPEDFRESTREVWLEFVAGNLLMPNLARIRVNGYPVDYRAETPRARLEGWERWRAWDYRIRMRFPLELFEAGENTVLVSTHLLPGLVRVLDIDEADEMHNMSLAQIGVEVVGK
jgi:hypothetical protein